MLHLVPVKIAVRLHCTNSSSLRLEAFQCCQTMLDTFSHKHMVCGIHAQEELPSQKVVTHLSSGTTFQKCCLEMLHFKQSNTNPYNVLFPALLRFGAIEKAKVKL